MTTPENRLREIRTDRALKRKRMLADRKHRELTTERVPIVAPWLKEKISDYTQLQSRWYRRLWRWVVSFFTKKRHE